MEAQHEMPFGAQVGADGSTRFRLWAPSARQVDIGLRAEGAAEKLLQMPSGPGGWYELVTAAAPHGTRYRYRIDGIHWVPDPASRFNPEDVHAASRVVDPRRFAWQDAQWRGRPWPEAVIYELHLGTFSTQGTYAGAAEHLDYLVDLGVTAIELMPIADFRGSRGWGYDAVLPFCPDAAYGSPDDLRELVQAAHARGLMVLLDVVYNHFGPDGNYLHLYAPEFFLRDRSTEWGSAIDFSGPHSLVVRDFFIHNALYWLEEYRFDGLRLDAVHSIFDDSDPDILQAIAAAVHAGPGRERAIHLVLENHANEARYLRSAERSGAGFDAQWDDDFHHAAHVMLTGERRGYYVDYLEDPVGAFTRSLTEGFAYQGEPSRFASGRHRGEPSGHLPADCFVNFLQNHDQVGNRAFGERISMLAEEVPLRALLAILLLAPSPPLLFMGEEFAADSPFLFFCDFPEELARSVREGRQRLFETFKEPERPPLAELSDPNDPLTFQRCKLRWSCLDEPAHRTWLDFYRHLLGIRKDFIVPRIPRLDVAAKRLRREGRTAFRIEWRTGRGDCLCLRANLGPEPTHGPPRGAGKTLFSTHAASSAGRGGARVLPPWSVEWFLRAA